MPEPDDLFVNNFIDVFSTETSPHIQQAFELIVKQRIMHQLHEGDIRLSDLPFSVPASDTPLDEQPPASDSDPAP